MAVLHKASLVNLFYEGLVHGEKFPREKTGFCEALQILPSVVRVYFAEDHHSIDEQRSFPDPAANEPIGKKKTKGND
ncbi:hypothetical protein SAY87_022404 [Trapa incisa]|uniref:Uncharacterized protein n=1 Tax=Trapa incisa TaxID=236973 RepID=A0AAN7Q4M2_9MYRT|nr:hypothetical protein SAY87_022404 [Trapa incisa]